jgi:NADPH:quinone reductase-like Zn-dependent oxidoreductase
MEFSGVVEQVGEKVASFKKGDEVFGSGGMHMSSYAEYICRPANGSLAIKPTNVTFEEVAPLIVGGLNALHFLKRANIQAGQKVLINGAGGSIGTFAVQLARLYGAEVTAVDRTDKLSMLRDIGADFVIDYTREDFTSADKKYDVIFDVVYKSSFWRCVNSLKEGGCYLMANTGPRRMLLGLLVSWTTNKRIVFELAGEKIEDMDYLAELIASGKIKTVIDKTYTLDQIQAAHAYVEKGNKKGSVVIKI